MSEQFYNYLAERVVQFLEERHIKAGDRFYIQFEKEEQVKGIYESLCAHSLSQEFNYPLMNPNYRTKSIPLNNIQLVLAGTFGGVTPHYLTHLRNLVGEIEHEQFADTAILFINNTDLDSLVKGSESLHKEGMPFHPLEFMQRLKDEVENSTLNNSDKVVICYVISKHAKELFQDHSSVFDFVDIINVILNNGLCKMDFTHFNLFFDKTLEGTKKELEKRLSDNAYLFKIVDDAHRFGNPEVDLEKYFDPKGIELLKDPKWKDITSYSDIQNSYNQRLVEKPLEYFENEKKLTNEGLLYWERAKGETKVQKRIRNLIVFNTDKLQQITFELAFSDHLSGAGLKVYRGSAVQVVTSGKKLRVTLNHTSEITSFSRFVYQQDSVKYDFRVAVVECSEDFLRSIKTRFSVAFSEKSICAYFEDDQIVFSHSSEDVVECEIDEEQKSVIIEQPHQCLVCVKNMVLGVDDIQYARLDVQYMGSHIPLILTDLDVKPISISGVNVWRMKREAEDNFYLQGENKLVFKTNEFFATKEFRKNLDLEKILIQTKAHYFLGTAQGIVEEPIQVPEQLVHAYMGVIDYFCRLGSLPSLAYVSDELYGLYFEYLQVYIDILSSYQSGALLDKSVADLMKFCTIRNIDMDEEILFTPLHPINIAYQLTLKSIAGKSEISEDIMKHLSSNALTPYIFKHGSKELYKVFDQNHSPEWTYFVKADAVRYQGSRDFVSKLVREKVGEFRRHFAYLFNISKSSAIRINLVNMGDCKEVLQGIFDYIMDDMKDGIELQDLLCFEVHIYGMKNTRNVFEELSFNYDLAHMKNEFRLRIGTETNDENEIINAFREKVRYFIRDIGDEQYAYSHLTFYQLEHHQDTSSCNTEEIATGVSMKGLLSGVPSVYSGGYYRTGFGTKYAECSTDLMKTVRLFNGLMNTKGGQDQFDENKAINTAISDESRGSLNKIYDSAHWVTFVDPKVDLHFFKNDIHARDLLIIHYSDQYSSSSGYDAITVTRKSKQYQVLLEDFLHKMNVSDAEKHTPKLINMFNAINGDWLLRLIASERQFPREKLSILSAIKVGLSYLYHEKIAWIPVSLEEVLRVSGGTGLKSTEGLFSTKNLGKKGAFSDDILFVGVENHPLGVRVHFYPVEVKIGQNESNVIETAKKQVRSTKELLNYYLKKEGTEHEVSGFTRWMYRNFLIQLALVSADKMKLYHVWPEFNWDSFLTEGVRTKLLNDDYQISNELDECVGIGAVYSFKKDVHFRSAKMNDDILHIEMKESDGYQFTIESIQELKRAFVNGYKDLDKYQMLSHRYVQNLSTRSNAAEQESNELVISPKTELAQPTGLTDALESSETVERADGIVPEPVVDESEEEPLTVVPIVEVVQENKKALSVWFGTNCSNGERIEWLPTDTQRTMHTNTGIIGTMGTGKTQFTKSLITQLYRESANNVDGRKIGILIFDYKGDYIKKDFVEATDAKVYDLYHLPYNPLALFQTEITKNLLPLHTANSLKETISKAFNLGIKQETLLKDMIMETYRRSGIDRAQQSTWDTIAPTIQQVYQTYQSQDDVKEDSLYAAFSNLIDFEIFEPDPYKTKPLFDIIDGVTIINLSGMDEGIQNLVVAITLDIFYSQMQMAGHSKIDGHFREITKMILVDEADNFLSKDFKSIRKILKEGREFGVGTILSTQFLSHFSTADNDYANYILTWIIHNVSEISGKDVKFIFNTQSKGEEDNIINKIKQLEKHHSIVAIGNQNKPIHMRDRAFWEII